MTCSFMQTAVLVCVVLFSRCQNRLFAVMVFPITCAFFWTCSQRRQDPPQLETWCGRQSTEAQHTCVYQQRADTSSRQTGVVTDLRDSGLFLHHSSLQSSTLLLCLITTVPRSRLKYGNMTGSQIAAAKSYKIHYVCSRCACIARIVEH